MELIKTHYQMCSSRSLKFSFVKEDVTEKDRIKPQKFAQPPLKERENNQCISIISDVSAAMKIVDHSLGSSKTEK